MTPALVREHLLAGHLIDRAAMPLLLRHVDLDTMAAVAIAEWRGASPIYTRRMQRLLGFPGDDVTTIFKGMQLDIGAPPQFMDFRYEVHDSNHGEFWLDHCGALMDVEPLGDDFVTAMCHTIEDPTFPATACASNPRARVEPVHRPPRPSADHHPHCRWTVTIDPDREREPEPAEAVLLAATCAARLPLAEPASAGPGRRLYDGPLEADLDLGSFEPGVLAAIDDEVCLQGHLLSLGFQAAVRDRLGFDVAATLGLGALGGVGGVVSGRLRDALGVSGLSGIVAVLRWHPAFRPASYVHASIDGDGSSVRIELADGPAMQEDGAVTASWPQLLADGGAAADRAVGAIAAGADPRARCERVRPGDAVWELTLADEPAGETEEVSLTRFSTGATFVFVRR